MSGAGSIAGRAAALVTAAVIAAAGCSSSGGTKTSPSSSPSSSAAAGVGSSASGPSVGTKVTVTEKEYSLQLSRTDLTAGTYTFVATNAGTVAHALAISGPGVSTKQIDSISPGSTANLTVTLQAGSYELWCPIDGHKALGMDTHVQVAGAAGSTGGTGATPSASASRTGAATSATATSTGAKTSATASSSSGSGGYGY